MDFRLQQSLDVKFLEDAFILPWRSPEGKRVMYGGVVSFEGVYDKSSGWHEGIASDYPFETEQVEYYDETVVYIGCLYHVWGHAITDNLKKLWWLLDKSQEDYKLVYITVGNTPLPHYALELISLLGIDLRKAEHITNLRKYREIIVPDSSLVNVDEIRYYAPEFVNTIAKITSHIPTVAKYEKVYFTRTQLANSRDLGEENVERFFRKQGFQIIAPEKLSLSEQLEILHNCKTFASTEGSISHSTLFCQPGTEVLILKKVDFNNHYTNFINQAFRLNAVFINAGHSVLAHKERPWLGPFYVCITKELVSYFHQHFYVPYYLLFSWYKYRWKKDYII